MMPDAYARRIARRICGCNASPMHGRTYGLTEKHLLLRNEKADSVTRAGGYGDLRQLVGFASLAGGGA